MSTIDPIWLAGALAVAGIILLRLSWGRRGRSGIGNALGWTALVLGLAVGGWLDGAWGVSIAAIFAMGTAAILLAKAIPEQPRFRRKAGREGGRSELAQAEPSPPLVSGIITFVVTGLLALGASVLLALAVRSGMVAWGQSEANANVAVLGAVPLLWPLLTFFLLMTGSRIKQLVILTLISLSGAIMVFVPGNVA